jgi:hypothetical protein
MAANTAPIYSKEPDVQWTPAAITAANTAKDGTGTVSNAYTADPAGSGSWIECLHFKPTGTNVATVARIFINNGQSNATPANNTLFDEITLPAITNTETASQAPFVKAIRRAIPKGFKINITLGTAVSGGWQVTAFGGKY